MSTDWLVHWCSVGRYSRQLIHAYIWINGTWPSTLHAITTCVTPSLCLWNMPRLCWRRTRHSVPSSCIGKQITKSMPQSCCSRFECHYCQLCVDWVRKHQAFISSSSCTLTGLKYLMHFNVHKNKWDPLTGTFFLLRPTYSAEFEAPEASFVSSQLAGWH